MNPQYQFDHRLRSQCVDLAAGSSVLNEQIFLVKLLTADTARKLWAVEVGHSMSGHMCMSWFYFNLCSPVNLAHVMKVSQNECCTTVQKRNVKLIEETGGDRRGARQIGKQREWRGSTHLPLPARCCLTVCRILSSPPAGCNCSCPLPWQCHASANRYKNCGKEHSPCFAADLFKMYNGEENSGHKGFILILRSLCKLPF